MSLTITQISLVQGSWSKVVPIAEAAAGLFYHKLFELDPALKSLFKGDMKMQGQKLMSMLNTAVISLNDLGSIVPVVQESGRAHAAYGVVDKDYDTVAQAFLWTLEQGLGEDFTQEVKEAWTAVYLLLAGVMKDAANAQTV